MTAPFVWGFLFAPAVDFFAFLAAVGLLVVRLTGADATEAGMAMDVMFLWMQKGSEGCMPVLVRHNYVKAARVRRQTGSVCLLIRGGKGPVVGERVTYG